jgi:hypothetical protein
MESSETNINEIVIENEYSNIFPNQVCMKEVFLIETMEENRNMQT